MACGLDGRTGAPVPPPVALASSPDREDVLDPCTVGETVKGKAGNTGCAKRTTVWKVYCHGQSIFIIGLGEL